MASTDTKLDPAAEVAAAGSGPHLVESETKLATNPQQGESAKEETSTSAEASSTDAPVSL